MARTTVAYWQHVDTGEVFAVRVDDDGAIVSARGPLTPAEVGAVLFDDPVLGTARRDAPTTANAEIDATALDHLRGVDLDQDTEYISLAPYRRPSTGCQDESEDGA